MFQELCPKEVFCRSGTLLQLEAQFEEVLTHVIYRGEGAPQSLL